MASPVTEIDVDGTMVRVSNPDRVIFPATDATPEATKLDVVNYYASVGEGILRALHLRPTTLERWPKGVFPDIKQATRSDPHGDAFFQKRVPKGAPAYVETARIEFPSGRSADEVCPTEAAVAAWAAQIGTITFHPWPVRRTDVDHPDELRLDLDPQPGTSFADSALVAGEARGLLEELGIRGFPKTSGNRGVHIYIRIEPRWTFTDVRHAAIAFGRELERRMPGRVTTNWWKEERGETVFIDYNQNARDRTIASAYCLRPLPGGPVSTPVEWAELEGLRPARVHPAHRAGAHGGEGRPARGDRRRAPLARAAARDVRTRRGRGKGRHALPARVPQDAWRAAEGPAKQEESAELGRCLTDLAVLPVVAARKCTQSRSPLGRSAMAASAWQHRAMNNTQVPDERGRSSPASAPKNPVDIWALEYAALRAETLSISNYRFQSLTVAIAGAAILLNWSNEIPLLGKYWAIALAIVVVVVAFLIFIRAGWHVGDISHHLAGLENKINCAMSTTSGAEDRLLTWETDQWKHRNRLGRMTIDRRQRPPGG